MRITSKGQVTIPAHIRMDFGFLPNTEVEFVVENGFVHLQRVENPPMTRGQRIVERLRGTGSSGMTTDEIMAMTRGYGEDDDVHADAH